MAAGNGRRESLTADYDGILREGALLPALSEARRRTLTALSADEPLPALVAAIESSIPLTLAVLKVANRREPDVAGVPEALAALDAGTIRAAVETVPALNPLQEPSPVTVALDGQRLHAISVATVTDRIARAIDRPDRHELVAAAILHDVGKLLLLLAYPDAALEIYDSNAPPDEALLLERDAFGIDHAQVGGLFARSEGLPERLELAIRDHHVASDSEPAAVVRLADTLVRYGHGHGLELEQIRALSASVGLAEDQLSVLIYELPQPDSPADRVRETPPLSERELDVLRLLAEGKVYKQVALELGLSPSTVRSHLHRIYTRMGVAGRTQAILVATERGWI